MPKLKLPASIVVPKPRNYIAPREVSSVLDKIERRSNSVNCSTQINLDPIAPLTFRRQTVQQPSYLPLHTKSDSELPTLVRPLKHPTKSIWAKVSRWENGHQLQDRQFVLVPTTPALINADQKERKVPIKLLPTKPQKKREDKPELILFENLLQVDHCISGRALSPERGKPVIPKKLSFIKRSKPAVVHCCPTARLHAPVDHEGRVKDEKILPRPLRQFVDLRPFVEHKRMRSNTLNESDGSPYLIRKMSER